MTTTPVPLPTSSIPTLPSLSLSDREKALMFELSGELLRHQFHLRVSEAYYLGEQHIKNLRIAVPRELEFLRTIVGWPSFAVDPYVERLAIDGFRLPGATDADADLTDLALAIGLDALMPLATTDALSLGRGYWVVGSPADGSDVPDVTVESPLNMAVKWDLRGTTPIGAWQTYFADNRRHAVLMRPGVTVTMATDGNGTWQVVDRDEHDLDLVPVVRMPHQPRTTARGGRSAISPAIRSVTDSACRDLMGLEVSREFYSAPKVTLLGASEADFQDANGNAKTGWEALITKYNAIERDEDGNIPTIHQLTAYDPSVFTKVLDMRASQMASLVAAPPQDLGLYTQGNPVSADAVGAMETRRNRRTKRMQAEFAPAIIDAMKLVLRFMNGGQLPDRYRRITSDWAEIDEESLAVSSLAMQQQVAAGIVPPTSDVVLKRLGYSAVERQRLAQDREAEQDQQAAQQIVAAIQGQGQQPQNGQEPAGGNTVGA